MGIISDSFATASANLVFMQVQQKAARTFFYNEARKVPFLDPTKLLKEVDTVTQGPVVPGMMYIFQYDAKTKETLPYWDRFPCIFPIEVYDNSFLGINLHYLPLDLRVRLMDALYTLAFNNEHDETYRLRISYDILKSATKFKAFKPCIKKYLNTQVINQRLHIVPWTEWSIVVYLPLARWQKQKSRVVHADSRRMIKTPRKAK